MPKLTSFDMLCDREGRFSKTTHHLKLTKFSESVAFKSLEEILICLSNPLSSYEESPHNF